MRPFKPQIGNKKLKPSRFFENFIQQKGPGGITRASSMEIKKNLRSFYLDLAYGNVVQEKYMEFIYSDSRVINEAMIDIENKLLEFTIVLRSMDVAINTNDPIISQPQFNEIYGAYLTRSNTYEVILVGLKNFAATGDPNYLVSISAKLNASIIKNSKYQLML